MMTKTETIIRRISTDYLTSNKAEKGEKLPPVRQLAKKYSVSPVTVCKAIENLSAKGLITKRQGSGTFCDDNSSNSSEALGSGVTKGPKGSHRIGYIAHNMDEILGHRVLKGIETVSSENDCSLEIANSNYSIEKERKNIERMVKLGVEGIVLYPTADRAVEYEYLGMEFREMPIVTVDIYRRTMMRSHVIFDNFTAGREMTHYLRKAGCNNIAFLRYGEYDQHSSLIDRYRGYQKALEEASLEYKEDLVGTCGYWKNMRKEELTPVFNTIKKLLESKNRPDAIIAPMDFCAKIIIKYLALNGVSVPDDITVVGFDNNESHSHKTYTLHSQTVKWPTTNPDFEQMGYRAAKTLLQSLNSDEDWLSEVLLPAPLLLPKKLKYLTNEAVT